MKFDKTKQNMKDMKYCKSHGYQRCDATAVPHCCQIEQLVSGLKTKIQLSKFENLMGFIKQGKKWAVIPSSKERDAQRSRAKGKVLHRKEGAARSR